MASTAPRIGSATSPHCFLQSAGSGVVAVILPVVDSVETIEELDSSVAAPAVGVVSVPGVVDAETAGVGGKVEGSGEFCGMTGFTASTRTINNENSRIFIYEIASREYHSYEYPKDHSTILYSAM